MSKEKIAYVAPDTGEPLTTRPRKRWVAVLAATVATAVTAIWEAVPVPQMLGDLIARALGG